MRLAKARERSDEIRPFVTISRSPFSRMAVEATRSARAIGLHYVLDSTPGIASLVIPPAWTNMWICTDSHGHLQAIGRDAKGRKQYRCHPCWNDVRNEDKYDQMLMFGRLPRSSWSNNSADSGSPA